MSQDAPAPPPVQQVIVTPTAPTRVGWLEATLRYGFLTIFAVVALGYGIYFGTQLLATQREGITAIGHIQDTENAQAQQLAELNQRLEQQGDALTVIAATLRQQQAEGGP